MFTEGVYIMTETTLVNLVSTWGYFAIAAGMFRRDYANLSQGQPTFF